MSAPVPYGMLIDAGRPDRLLALVSELWLANLLFAGSAGSARQLERVPVPAE